MTSTPSLAQAAQEYEHQLWLWLNEQRIELHAGTLLPARREYLDTHVPGWDNEPPTFL